MSIDSKQARPAEYGSLRLVVDGRYRIVQAFKEHDGPVRAHKPYVVAV